MTHAVLRMATLVLAGMLATACASVSTSTPAPAPTPVPPLTATPAPSAVAAPSARVATPEAATRVLLDVAVSDLTERRSPDVEIWVRGHGSWYPDLEFGGDVTHLGSFPVGEPDEFFVYPDGRDGKEVGVPFEMKADMISGSDRDRTHVEIHDKSVVVWGTAIRDFEITKKR